MVCPYQVQDFLCPRHRSTVVVVLELGAAVAAVALAIEVVLESPPPR
jgi:hypothetical protein